MFIPLEEPLDRAANHGNLVEAHQIQFAIRESLVDMPEELAAGAVAENPRDKVLPVFKIDVVGDQVFRLCNLKVASTAHQSNIRESETHGAPPSDAVAARFALREFMAVMQLPSASKRREHGMIMTVLGAFNESIPKLGLKKIPREGLYKDLVLGVEQMHVHLLNDGDVETESLLEAESARWCILLAKHEKAIKRFHQAIYAEIARQELLDTLFWNPDPSFAVSKRGRQEATEFLLGETILYPLGFPTERPRFELKPLCRFDGKNKRYSLCFLFTELIYWTGSLSATTTYLGFRGRRRRGQVCQCLWGFPIVRTRHDL